MGWDPVIHHVVRLLRLYHSESYLLVFEPHYIRPFSQRPKIVRKENAKFESHKWPSGE